MPRLPFAAQIAIAAIIPFAASLGLARTGLPSAGPSASPGTQLVEAASAGCTIKGNVSIETGERIYHVPGQRYYESTKIDPAYGERWFCSEAEARAAGWRTSKV